ncbi:MAG: alpha/beta fold hydrolase [Rhodomicrobium sp.]
MALFVLVPGAGGMAWYWHRVVPLLGSAGHQAIAVDLPGDDRDAGLAAYADIVIRAIAERSDAILVAQSLAGFTAPLVCARAPVRMLIFVNAMIPKPFTTCCIACCAPDRNRHVRRPTPFSASPAALSTGPTSPFMFWQEEMTAFSRSNFNDVSRAKGLERRYSKSPVVISSRCRMPTD